MLAHKFFTLILTPLAWALTIPVHPTISSTSNKTSKITFDITFEVTVDVTSETTSEAASMPVPDAASNTTNINSSNATLPAANITLPQNFTLPPPPGPPGPAPLCFWSPSPEMHDTVCRYRCVDECPHMSAENGRALFFTNLKAQGKKCFSFDKDGRPGIECWRDPRWVGQCWEVEFACAPW